MELTKLWNVFRLLITVGIAETLKLVAMSLGLAVGFGMILGTLRALRIPIVSQLLQLYGTIIRGTPILVILLVSYFVLPFPTASSAAVFALVFSHAAYIMEIFRGGIESVDKLQWEAGLSLSMSRSQVLKWVVLPQVALVVLPALVGQLVVLVKDTAMASVIGFVEITRMGRSLMQVYGHPLEIFGLVLILYFGVCHTLARVGEWLERKMSSKILSKDIKEV